MNLIKTDLKKVRKILSNIEIRKSPQLFSFEDIDFILKSNPNIQTPTLAESKITPEDEAEGCVELMADDFFGSDNGHIYLPNLFESIKKELHENLLMPIETSIKDKYVDEILNLYVNLESDIVEDKEGNFINEKIKFVEDINTNQVDRDIYSGTLSSWKLSLRQEILYLNNLKIKLSKNNSESKIEEPIKVKDNMTPEPQKVPYRIFLTKSFSLNPKLYNSDPQKADAILAEKLKNFHESLLKYGFISKIDYRYFLHAFTNKKIIEQIRWERDAKELYYLIKSLYDQELIVHFKNYWEIACKCFIAYHKKSKLCTPDSLSRCHAPTLGDRLRKLNSAIDTLK